MRSIESKIVSLQQMETLSHQMRNQGKKLVSTNGCFDVLHWGHIKYLSDARELGDALVVGLNSDHSVRSLKGPERPIYPEAIRLKQLAGLESVDYVVLFEEPTPENFLGVVKPAVHAKGGDYDPKTLPERQVVEAAGGKVVCLPFVPGLSTTGLIERLRK
jgi:rfaE bifunctional protein nucleotidyltransferase chain/domain